MTCEKEKIHSQSFVRHTDTLSLSHTHTHTQIPKLQNSSKNTKINEVVINCKTNKHAKLERPNS